MKRVVVCAANRYDKKVFLGIRHFCPLMVEHMKDYDIAFMREEFGEEQGFVDQYGVFMDRKEAYKVAKASGQVGRYRAKNPGEWLCTEDLY